MATQAPSIVTIRPEERHRIRATVNGVTHEIDVEARETLLDLLQLRLGLTGTKRGCDLGECGACTVLLGEEAVYSCLILAPQVDGAAVTTIEGLEREGTLDPVQRAFIEADALQCGFCTPGQIMAVKGFLAAHPSAEEEEVLEALSGNLCRCGAYPGLVKAVRQAVRGMRDA